MFLYGCSEKQNRRSNNSNRELKYGTVTGTIIDGDDGKPVPARVYAIGSDDSVYMADECLPYDRPVYKERIGYTGRHFTTTGNTFTVHLPPGPATIIIERGKEYMPIEEKLRISPGVTLTKEFVTERWINMASMGWYSGDIHVHRLLTDLADLMIAEDLNVASPQTVWNKKRESDLDLWLKKADASGVIMIDDHHMFSVLSHEIERFNIGAATMHHTGKTIIPVYEHYNRTPLNIPFIKKTHAVGGYVDIEKPNWPESHIDIAVGKGDFIGLANNHFTYKNYLPEHQRLRTEFKKDYSDGVRGYCDYIFDLYYAYLNCGFKVMPSAGSASGVLPNPLGYNRIYVKVDGAFTFDNWFKALKAGHSFATNGPMLIMKIDGKLMGETINVKAQKDYVAKIVCEVHSFRHIDRLEIIRDGECVHTAVPQITGYSAVVKADIPFSASGWVLARCFERVEDTVRFAHTAPVFIEIEHKPFKPRRYAAEYFLCKTQEVLEETEKDDFPTEQDRKAAMDVYRKAVAIYSELLKQSR